MGLIFFFYIEKDRMGARLYLSPIHQKLHLKINEIRLCLSDVAKDCMAATLFLIIVIEIYMHDCI